MKTLQGNMLVSLRAVDTFLDTNAAILDGVVTTGARRKLTGAIVDLSTHASDQTGGAMATESSAQSQLRLRQALLRDHMAPIASIARAELPLTPEVVSLRMPRGRPTSPKLVAAAEGMAKNAAPYASVFVDNGRPVDFIAQLNSAAEALITAAGGHTNIKGKRKAATTGIQDRLTAGRKIVHVLDTYVKSALKDEPVLLSNWNAVKRVPRTGIRPAATATPAPAPAPVATSTPIPTPTPTTA